MPSWPHDCQLRQTEKLSTHTLPRHYSWEPLPQVLENLLLRTSEATPSKRAQPVSSKKVLFGDVQQLFQKGLRAPVAARLHNGALVRRTYQSFQRCKNNDIERLERRRHRGCNENQYDVAASGGLRNPRMCMARSTVQEQDELGVRL